MTMYEMGKFILNVPQFMITWSFFFGFGIIFYAIYVIRKGIKFSPRELMEHCIPFNILTEKSFHADIMIYGIGKIIDGLITLPAVVLSAWCATRISHTLQVLFYDFQKPGFGLIDAAACTLIVFIIVEFADFICHYAEHKIPFLWELHKVHHSAQILNPLTALREHPCTKIFESFVRGLLVAIPGGIFMFLFDLSAVEIVLLPAVARRIFVLASLDPLKHSHHAVSLGALDKFLISPHMHQMHHSKKKEHWDKNFGTNLSIFDWIAGTAYKPAAGEQAAYGISGMKDETVKSYNTFKGAYWAPLKKSAKKFAKAVGGYSSSTVRLFGGQRL